MSAFDLIIKNGIIVDGSGAPPFKADIGIVNDTIVKIGNLSVKEAERVIDASNLIVAPGFIDIHNHSDEGIFLVPTADNYVMQGVTTLVIGNCGFSPAPITDENIDVMRVGLKKLLEKFGTIPWRSFPEYMKALGELEKSVNIVTLIGHGTVRSAVLGAGSTQPSERDLKEMICLVRKAMEAGAFGLSTGLIYVPGLFAKTQELIEMAKAIAPFHGIYATHMRNEGVGLLDSIMETITIGISSGVSVEISHLKSTGIPAWGYIKTALSVVENYAERGYDISADAYPYAASSTGLDALLPPWVREGGILKLIERLRDSSILDEISKEFERRGIMEERYLEWNQIVIAYSEVHKELEGRSIEEIAQLWGIDPVKAIARIITEDDGATAIIIHSMSEDDVRRALAHPLVAIGSDGSVRRFGEGKPHPRNYGTFPRVISEYVRKHKLLSLPEAIRKMTSLPARKLRLWDRGLIRPGFKADITIFNYHSIKDTATYESPHNYPRGIEYVIVNGIIVVEEGRHTKAKAGRLLKSTWYR